MNSVQIKILFFIWNWLAVKLTDWENWRLEEDYVNALALKKFMFQSVNA